MHRYFGYLRRALYVRRQDGTPSVYFAFPVNFLGALAGGRAGYITAALADSSISVDGRRAGLASGETRGCDAVWSVVRRVSPIAAWG
jgi:hypothetical protein